MERIKRLNRYQKSVLLFMVVMALVFAVVYSMTISRVGFKYKNTILVQSRENGSTMYSGKIKGQQAQFTVSEDKTVVFQYGDKTYAPYTAKEDSHGDNLWLYNEDGTFEDMGISFVTSNGIEMNENGNVVDSMKPSVSDILNLMDAPNLTHKGKGFVQFGAVFICVLNALCILFADELFRWNLTFQIRNVDHAEPSDWEIAGRYIGWTVMSIMALVIFIMGLQQYKCASV